AGVQGGPDHLVRIVAATPPVGDESPGAETDLRDLEIAATEPTKAHGSDGRCAPADRSDLTESGPGPVAGRAFTPELPLGSLTGFAIGRARGGNVPGSFRACGVLIARELRRLLHNPAALLTIVVAPLVLAVITSVSLGAKPEVDATIGIAG